MKKTNIYKLLCTTILTSAVSLAADEKPLPGTPQPSRVAQLRTTDSTPLTPISADSESKRKQILESALKTPDIKKQQELKYPVSKYDNPERRNMFVNLSTEQVRLERDEKTARELEKVDEHEAKKRLERIAKEQEVRRAEKERQQEELFARATELARQNEQDNILLQDKLAEQEQKIKLFEQEQLSVDGQVKKLEEELRQANELGTFTSQAIQKLTEALAEQKKVALESKEKVRKATLEKEELRLKLSIQEQATKRAEDFIEKKIEASGIVTPKVSKEPIVTSHIVTSHSSSGGIVDLQLQHPQVNTSADARQPTTSSGAVKETKKKIIEKPDDEGF